MPLPENDQELLTAYLDGTLGQQERAEVDGRLQDEPGLREELERLQLATKALRFAALQQQVSAVRSAHEKENGAQTPVRRLPLLRYALSAAAVFLLVWIGSRMLQPAVDPAQLYARHFVEYTPGQARGPELDSDLIDAAYRGGQYAEVIRLYRTLEIFDGIARNTRGRMTLQCALAHMHLQQWNDALGRFTELKASPYAEDAEYYTALVFLRTGKYGEAEAILQKIHDNPAHLYHQQSDADFIRAVGRLK